MITGTYNLHQIESVKLYDTNITIILINLIPSDPLGASSHLYQLGVIREYEQMSFYRLTMGTTVEHDILYNV